MALTRITLALAAAAGTLAAQTAPAKPLAFEAASIKPHVFAGPLGGCARVPPGNHITLSCMSLRNLIMQAYDVKFYQIAGGPEWVTAPGDTLYDIVAKAEGDTVPNPAEVKEMLQALLADRFALKVHRETRQVPVYALVVAKNGPKLKESAPDERNGARFSMGGVKGDMQLFKSSPAQLALSLTNEAGRPVIDKTNITGVYDFALQWVRDEPQRIPGLQAPSAEALAAASNGPSLFTALEEQLGLKLESQKGPIDFIVVDRAERPSGN